MCICSIVPYNSRFGGKLGPKGLGQGGVYAMYSMKDTIWLRRGHGYLSAQASTDRKGGRLSLPFYSIEFFAVNMYDYILEPSFFVASAKIIFCLKFAP